MVDADGWTVGPPQHVDRWYWMIWVFDSEPGVHVTCCRWTRSDANRPVKHYRCAYHIEVERPSLPVGIEETNEQS